MPPEKNKESGLSPEIGRLTSQLARDPKSKLFIPLAEEYMKAGMAEEAIMALEEGLKVHPAYMSARVLLGKACMEKGDTDGAITQFETVIKTIPDNLLAHKKLAEAYKAQGRYKEAIKSLRVVTILSPKDDEAQLLLKELESGPPPPETHPPENAPSQAEEAVRNMPPYSSPATPPEAEEDEEIEEPPIYDLSDAAGVGFGEYEAGAAEGVQDTFDSGVPGVVEMPVPEMDTLQQARQAEPYQEGLRAQTVFENEPALPASMPDEILEAGFAVAEEEENPFGFSGEALTPELALPAMMPDEMPEAGFAIAEEEPKPKVGYAVDLKAKGDLEDIFAAYGGGAEAEAVSWAAQPVYELSDDLSIPGEGTDVDDVLGEAGTAGPVMAGESAEIPEPLVGAEKEPFKTETLAELYISQGFYDRAINIYKDLLVESPGNKGLKQKLDDLYQLAALTSTKAAARAKEEVPSQPKQEYEPVDFEALEGEGEIMPFEAEALDASPFEAEAIESIPFEEEAMDASPFEGLGGPVDMAGFGGAAQDAVRAEVDYAAIRRLEQFLENVRRKGAR